ncbi:MAG: hypothetical protein NTZ24_01675, partial [Deltaproteobacteria bacterium]|nr:hypothetical protein [Deltaproteobacteria bacterium]
MAFKIFTIQERTRWMLSKFFSTAESAECDRCKRQTTGKITVAVLISLIVLLPLTAMGQGTVFYPNDPYFSYDVTARPGFPGQWHLFNQAPSSIYFTSVSWGQTVQMINAGVDANLKTAWNLGYTGRGVVIGIVDDGVDGANYDVAPGYRSDLSRNFSDNAAVAAASQGP